jgi:hypothetical protein
VSDEIRAFDWQEEQERRRSLCFYCGTKITQGYVYYDKLSLTYCMECFYAHNDVCSLLKP